MHIDRQAEMFNYNKGEFSAWSDEKFEQHLAILHSNKNTTKFSNYFWYGALSGYDLFRPIRGYRCGLKY